MLTAQRSVLTSQSALNASATATTLAMVNLYKALGGGWNPRALDSAALLDPSHKVQP